MSSVPRVYVEIARAQGWATGNFFWTDITDYVENPEGIKIEHARKDEISTADADSLSLTLLNRDGRFTPGYASGAYYPDVKKGLPIRVTARWPLPTGAASEGNYHPNPSVETSLTGPDGNTWATNTVFGTYDANTSVTRDNTRAHTGSWSVKAVAPTSTKGCFFTYPFQVVQGREYTISAWVYNTGSGNVRLDVAFWGTSTHTTTKNAWVKLSCTFTAGSSTIFPGIIQEANTTAGDAVWTDEWLCQEGTTVGTYNTNDPADYNLDRFVGYVDDWPLIWPGGISVSSQVSITAHGPLARLGRDGTFKSLASEAILADSPIAYYPLNEPGGTTLAGDISGNNLTPMKQYQYGTGGLLVFGEEENGGPLGGDDDPYLRLDRASVSNGKYLGPDSITQTLYGFLNTFTSVEACFRTTTTGAEQTVAIIYIPGGQEMLRLALTSAGAAKIEVTLFDGVDTFNNGSNTTGSFADGDWHHAAVWIEETSSTTVTAKLMVDGGTPVAVGPYTRANFGTGHPVQPPFNRLRIGQGDGTSGQLFDGDIAHVAVFSEQYNGALASAPATGLAVHADAAISGFNPETISTRLAHYADYAGFPSSRVSVSGSTQVGHVPLKGVSPLEAMRLVERTDGGVLFDGRTGTLSYNARTARYSASSAFTLDATQGHFEDDVEFRLDDQYLINEVTGARSDGGQVRVVDATSQATYGPYALELSIAGVDDNQVLAAAQWWVSLYAEPQTRVPQITSNVYAQDSTLAGNLLAADVGTLLTVSNLPSQAPYSSATFFVEGYTEEIDPNGWRITYYLSPGSAAAVWLLADTTLGKLDVSTTLGY